MSSQTPSQPSWLLLLPSPPGEVTLQSIRTAYSSTLSQVLQKSADISLSCSEDLVLDIALPCPNVSTSDIFDYSYLQNLLRQVYSLTCLLCTELSIDVQYGNDVDVRVLLFQASDLDGTEHVEEVKNDPNTGPIVSLATLACCNRSWQRVCLMDNKNGENVLQRFQQLRKPSRDDDKDHLVVERIPADGSLPTLNDPATVITHNPMARAHHESVAVGGTFDHLHVGHKLLLSMTALVLSPAGASGTKLDRTMTVGLTGDKLLENKKFRDYLQDWHQRQTAVQTFLQDFLVVEAPSRHVSFVHKETGVAQRRVISNSWLSGLTIQYVEIFDPFGPTITDEAISALVLSEETRAGGKAVNEKRAEKDWPALDTYEVNVLDLCNKDARSSNEEMHEFQDKISSTEIRRRLSKRSGLPD